MSKHSKKSNTADLFDWSYQSEVPLQWGDLPEIPLDPETDTYYWGFRQDVSVETDADPLDRADQPKDPRSGSDGRMQEEKRHVEDMCSKLRVAEKKIQELQSKLQDMEVKKENLEVKLTEAMERNRGMVKERKQQDAARAQLESKLQDLQKENEGLQEKLTVTAVTRTVLIQQKPCDAKCKLLESKLQEAEERNGSFQEILNKELGKKATILKEKKDLKVKHTEVKLKLETSEKRHRVVQAKLEDMLKQNKNLQGWFHKAQTSNAEMEKKLAQVLKENQQLGKSQRNMQDVLQESTKRNGELVVHCETLEACKGALEKKCAGMQGRMEEMEICCTRLEAQNAESLSDLHTVILQHKDLLERCLKKKKKKKRVKFLQRSSAPSAQTQLSSSANTCDPSP